MSFSRAGTSTKKKLNPLDKRIPENPRYAHIKHTIDTGSSVSKYLRHLEEVKQNYRYRKDEIFRRLKVTTFGQLVLQVELHLTEGELEEEREEEEEVKEQNGCDCSKTDNARRKPADGSNNSFLPQGNNPSPPDTARSSLSSVVSGMGEMDVKEKSFLSCMVPAVHMIAPTAPPSPYLLLDVRDRDSYELAHIITAKSYPATMLSRSCNYFTKDIMEYKNKSGRIIILYDEDERMAPQAATIFIQREVDNIFILSGGMKVLSKTFPGCMITGPLPPSCRLSPPNSSRSTVGSGRRKLNGHGMSSKGMERVKPLISATSTVQAEGIEHKERFAVEDLGRIQTYLDDAFLAGSVNSRSTTTNSRSCITSSRSTTNARQHTTSRSTSRSTSKSTLGTPWK